MDETTPNVPKGTRGHNRASFKKGNPGGPGSKGNPSAIVYAKKLADFFATPEIELAVYEKIKRELAGNSQALFTLKMLAYAIGEPTRVLELKVREKAARLAGEAGVTVEHLILEAERLATESDASGEAN
jgi:hypothetical protein